MKDEKPLANPIAYFGSPNSNQLVKPADANSDDDYFCIDENCTSRDFTLKRSINNRKFFSHKSGNEHPLSTPETLLHVQTIDYISKLAKIRTKGFISNGVEYQCRTFIVDPERSTKEYRGIKTIRPDLRIISIEGFEFLVEVYVTNPMKEEKLEIIEGLNLPCLEIDLSSFYDKNKEACKNIAFIEERLPSLINDIGFTWRINPENENIKHFKKEPPFPWKWVLGFLVVLLSIFRWLRPSK